MPIGKVFIFILSLTFPFLEAAAKNTTCHAKTLVGRRVIVSFGGTPPFIIRKNGGIVGADIDVLNILAQKLAFEYTLESQKVFGLIKNGKWTGIIGEVAECDAHIGLGPFTLNYHTCKVVDFGFPIYDLSLKLVVPKPKKLPPFINVIKPFDWTLWAALLLSGSTLPITYYLVSRWYYEGKAGIPSFYLKSMAMLFGQDVLEWFRKEMPKAMLVAVLLFGTSMLSMAYESNLRAYLMMEDYETQMNTIEDVVRMNGPFKLYSLVIQITLLRDSPKLSYRKLYERCVRQGNILPLTSNFITILKDLDGAAHFGQDIVFGIGLGAMIKLYGFLPFEMKPKPLTSDLGTLIVPKGSGYRDDLYNLLMHMFEKGIMNHLVEKNLDFKSVASYINPKEDENEPLVFSHILLPLVSLCFGWVISTLIFWIEVKGKGQRKEESKMYYGSDDPEED